MPRQVGYKLEVLFKQPIVDDKLEYITDKKSDGYNIKNGRKKLKVGEIAVVNCGRKKKHQSENNWNNQNYSDTIKTIKYY